MAGAFERDGSARNQAAMHIRDGALNDSRGVFDRCGLLDDKAGSVGECGLCDGVEEWLLRPEWLCGEAQYESKTECGSRSAGKGNGGCSCLLAA